MGTVTLTADRSPRRVPDSEIITVTLSHGDDSTADERDYTLSGSEVKFTATGTTATFKVDVDADEDVSEEALVLGAMVEGVEANGLNPSEKDPHETLDAIVFGDATDKQIEARSYAEIEAARDAGENGGRRRQRAVGTGREADPRGRGSVRVRRDHANVVLSNIVVEDPAILSAAATGDGVTVTAVGDGESPISITATVVERNRRPSMSRRPPPLSPRSSSRSPSTRP